MFFSIILLMTLILINGMFASAELAFLSIDKSMLIVDVKKGDKKAKMISEILSEPSEFLSTIQIGITLAGFLASAFAADYFADYFMELITISVISKEILKSILVVIITIILSYFTLVFGELVPKKIAINKPYEIAKSFVGIINFVKTFFHPLIVILTFSTNMVCIIFKIKDNNDKITEEDIKKMILLGNEEGIIEEKEKEYILNVFEFNDKEVKEVMTPKDKVTLIGINEPTKDIISKIKETKFSRYPVYNENINDIIGILNVKDFIIKYNTNKNLEIRNIIRPLHKFNCYKKIDDVFREMQTKNVSMGIIYDDQNFLGIVTIEDAIEEIVGNIFDEYDDVNKD